MNKSMEDAIRYIGSELKENPDADRNRLIQEASEKFDLNPLQTEFLVNKYIIEK